MGTQLGSLADSFECGNTSVCSMPVATHIVRYLQFVTACFVPSARCIQYVSTQNAFARPRGLHNTQSLCCIVTNKGSVFYLLTVGCSFPASQQSTHLTGTTRAQYRRQVSNDDCQIKYRPVFCNCRSEEHSVNQDGAAPTLYNCIREIIGSNHARNIGYPA